MQAIYLTKYGNPHSAFEIREEPSPSHPDLDELIVEVEASGINFADVLARLGLYQEAPKNPCVLGYEIVGRVKELGDNVSHLKKHQRVLAFTRFGGYASEVKTKATAVVPIPEEMDSTAAAALATQYSTAWYAAEEMVKLHKGDRILIQAAAGGVGSALVQIAKRRGCFIFGTAGTDEKLEQIKNNGVDYPINYRKHDFAEEIKKHSSNGEVDIVFDSIGGATFKKGFKLLGPGGRMVSFGVAEMAARKLKALHAAKAMISFGILHPVQLLLKSQGIIGVNLLQIADHKPEVLARCLSKVVELALKGELKPVEGKVFPANEVAQAHEYIESRRSTGKVILSWS